jgi:hypothetical protein
MRGGLRRRNNRRMKMRKKVFRDRRDELEATNQISVVSIILGDKAP